MPKPPERRLRELVGESGGSLDLPLKELYEEFGVDRGAAADNAITTLVEAVGLTLKPALRGQGPETQIRIKLAEDPNDSNEAQDPRRMSERRGMSDGMKVALVAVVLIVGALYFSGRMDPLLYKVGLNWNNCIQNAFGSVYCGKQAEQYQQSIQQQP